MKTPFMCLGRLYGSSNMKQDLFRSGHVFDLRANFQHNIMSNYNAFDASLQEEHDAAKRNVVPLLCQ